MYVDERDSLFREEIILFLEEKGYVISKTESRSRKEIIDYYLPIKVNEEEKTYEMMGNVTCAAADRSKGLLHTREEFFADFGQPEWEYEEYKRKIFKSLIDSTWNYSRQRAKEIIEENEYFVIKGFVEGEDADSVAIDIGFGCG